MMKFLIFNITVAAALAYLIAGDEWGPTLGKDSIGDNRTVSQHTEKPLLEKEPLSETEINPPAQDTVAKTDGTEHAAKVIDHHSTASASVEVPDSKEFYSEEFYAEKPQAEALSLPPVNRRVPEKGAINMESPEGSKNLNNLNGLDNPEWASHQPAPQASTRNDFVQNDMAADNIQGREGTSMMRPHIRQQELDKLVHSLELIYLDLSH